MAGETVERTRVVRVGPADVWQVLGDVTRMPEWSSELESVDLLVGDGRSVGRRLRGNNRNPGGHAWSMDCVIDGYEPERVLEFHTENDKGEIRTRWWYRLDAVAEGTAVTEGFLRVAKLGRVRELAERKLIGDRAEYNARNIDESRRRLAGLTER